MHELIKLIQLQQYADAFIRRPRFADEHEGMRQDGICQCDQKRNAIFDIRLPNQSVLILSFD
jgi:hypothetical protein